MRLRLLSVAVLIAATALFAWPALAELGSNNPPDQQLLMRRAQEVGCDLSTSPPTCPSPRKATRWLGCRRRIS